MKLYTISDNGKERAGILRDGKIYLFNGDVKMQDVIINGIDNYELENNGVPVDKAKIMSPIPEPSQDVICLGINYLKHGKEAAKYNKEAFLRDQPYAIYFSKRVNRAVATGEDILSHSDIVEKLDYECELAFIIGKDAKNVPVEDVQNYVFGYTIINDVSARDQQTNHKQWYFGKSLDGFTPMGPCIVTADEIDFPPVLELKSTVNGELRQSAVTSDMVFDVGHIVSELSAGMTLKAGTIIATGTPEGVGMGFDPPRFLKTGDEVVCEIEKIGKLINKVK